MACCVRSQTASQRAILFVCIASLMIVVLISKPNINIEESSADINWSSSGGEENELSKYKTRSQAVIQADSTKFVLIVTYARSGSSWLGEITNHGPGTFYIFEPFKGLIKEGYYYEGDVICFNNNTCRKSRTDIETNEFLIQQLYYIYTCQLSKTYKSMASSFRVDEHRECVKRHGKDCATILDSSCLKTTHRVVKTIRVSMEIVHKIMNMFPQLHVIHLVRDPRAVTGSRLENTLTFHMATDTDAQTTDLCQRISRDLNTSLQMYRDNPKRQMSVIYENLAENTQTQANRLFNFLKLKMTSGTVSWIYKSTHSGSKKSGYFGTSRNDPVSVAYRWRSTLSFKNVRIIDNLCKDVYKRIGYLPMKSEAQLRNLKVPSRRAP